MQAIRSYKISERNLLQQCFYQLISFIQAKRDLNHQYGSPPSQWLNFTEDDILLCAENLRQTDYGDEDEAEIKRMIFMLTNFSSMLVPTNRLHIATLEMTREGLVKLIDCILKKEWKNSGLQSAVIIILACFLEELRSRVVDVQESERNQSDWIMAVDEVACEEEVEKWVEEAIQRDGLVFLKDSVVKHVNWALSSSHLDEQD